MELVFYDRIVRRLHRGVGHDRRHAAATAEQSARAPHRRQFEHLTGPLHHDPEIPGEKIKLSENRYTLNPIPRLISAAKRLKPKPLAFAQGPILRCYSFLTRRSWRRRLLRFLKGFQHPETTRNEKAPNHQGSFSAESLSLFENPRPRI